MQQLRLLIFAWLAASSLAAESSDTRIIEAIFRQPYLTAKDADACVIGEGASAK